MDNESELRSANQQIVKYEQKIGDLIELLNEKQKRLAGKQKQITNLETEINSKIFRELRRLSRDQSGLVSLFLNQQVRNDAKFEMLAAIAAQKKSFSSKKLNSLMDKLMSESHDNKQFLTKILQAGVVESLVTESLSLGSKKEQQVFGGVAEMESYINLTALAQPAPILLYRENDKNSLHGINCSLGEKCSANTIRSIKIIVDSSEGRDLRFRVRERKNSDLHVEASLNLKTLRFRRFKNTFEGLKVKYEVSRKISGEKIVEMTFSSPVYSEELELLILSVEDADSKSSIFIGDRTKTFKIIEVELTREDGIITKEKKDAGSQDKPRDRIKILMPEIEEKRAANRIQFINSKACSRLAELRNKHVGRRAFIIGNGPSIQNQDLTQLSDEITFATNWFVNHEQFEEINLDYYCVSSHEMFGGWNNPQPSVNEDWYSLMDAKAGSVRKFFSYRFSKYIEEKRLFTGQKVDYLLFDRPKYQVDQKGDINLDLTYPLDDGYTGIITFCLPLAYNMGINEIYLIGCDCDYGITEQSDEKSYFYPYSEHKTKTTSLAGLNRAWAEGGPAFKSYEIVKKRFELDGIKIFNATDGGKLEVFPRVNFESILKKA